MQLVFRGSFLARSTCCSCCRIKQNKAGVLVGGRATVEDAYAYSKFARVTLNTNNIDFRSRVNSAEELDFLANLNSNRYIC
jgi:NADH-quinone oxidoreductase subunit G